MTGHKNKPSSQSSRAYQVPKLGSPIWYCSTIRNCTTLCKFKKGW